MMALTARDLSVKYGRISALVDCTLEIPSGCVTALIGTNGAGKTTFLNCAVGLLAPTAGFISVLGGLKAGSRDARDRVAYVAQDAPLYRNLTVSEMVDLTSNLNETFDLALARRRLASLDISPKGKIGGRSLGQQAQISLTLALARHPELLILDEPLARLDPLARRDFMSSVLAAAFEDGVSVLYSSHVVSELEHVADHLVILDGGRVRVSSTIESFVSGHVALSGPIQSIDEVRLNYFMIEERRAGRQARIIGRPRLHVMRTPDGWEEENVYLEELVLAYLENTFVDTSSRLSLVTN